MSGTGPIDDGPATRAKRLQEGVETFAHDFVVALLDRALHAEGSPTHRNNLDATARALRHALGSGIDLPLRIDFRGDCLCWKDSELAAATLQAGRLLRLAKERRLRSIAFDARVNLPSLDGILRLLGDPHAIDAFRPDTIEAALRRHGIRGIAIEIGDAPKDADVPGSPSMLTSHAGALRRYQALTDVLQESHVRAFHGDEIGIDAARGVVERAVASMNTAPSELLALSVDDDIDRFTVGHSVRVALLALQVARAAGADERELMRVGTCGLLHDIGKSLIPQEVLFKQSGLTTEEWAVMAEHPRLGAEILLEQRDVDPAAIGAAYCHHMGPDGLGYPRPQMPFATSAISKLVRICDVFEALTAVRPYKHELTPLEALAVMHREAKGFDPQWFTFFVQTIGIYPTGTRVLLVDGTRALVVRQGVAVDRPMVRPIADGSPDDLPAADSPEFAIGDRIDGVEHRIAGVLRRHHDAEHDHDPTATVLGHPATACLHPHDAKTHRT